MDSSTLTSPARQASNPHVSSTPSTTMGLQESGQVAAQSGSPKRAGKKRIRIQTEKRKEQNRSNQRAFRQRRERYVKELEASHHNLRHLVVHQGGEIESLKSRLVDISGGREGTEPSVPLDPLILGNPAFKVGSDSASPSGTSDSDDELDPFEDDINEPLSAGSSIGSAVPLPPVEHPQLPPMAHEPSPLQCTSITPHQAEQHIVPSSLALAMAIPRRKVDDDVLSFAPQYWTTSAPGSAEPPSSRTFSSPRSSTASSFASRGPWTPLDSSTMLQPVGPAGQPYLVDEPVPTASYQAWQSDTPGHLNDFSHWLQSSVQNTQYCLPYQESTGDATSMPERESVDDGMAISGYNWQSRNNALGLDNLFANLNSEDKMFSATDSLHLLGRPLTPFPTLGSPAEYAFAT